MIRYLVHATEETKQDPAYDADPETYNSEGEDDDDSGTDDDEFEADPRKGANEAELLNLAVRKMELEESRKTVRPLRSPTSIYSSLEALPYSADRILPLCLSSEAGLQRQRLVGGEWGCRAVPSVREGGPGRC